MPLPNVLREANDTFGFLDFIAGWSFDNARALFAYGASAAIHWKKARRSFCTATSREKVSSDWRRACRTLARG